MSFFTCFCDFPQKLHFTRSPPSPNFATALSSARTAAVPASGPASAPPPERQRWAPRRRRPSALLRCSSRPDRLERRRVPSGDHLVDDAVGDRFVGRHDEVAVGVLGDLLG